MIPSKEKTQGRDPNVSTALSSLTTFEVGGLPRYYQEVDCEEDAIDAFRWARERQIPIWVIGGGSNVICDDDHLDGLVLQLRDPQIMWGEPHENGEVSVQLGAGVVWSTFVEEAVKRGLSGVECLVGIPGWAGAAPIQNIGAYGQSLSDTCVSVRVYDRETDEVTWWDAARCQFGYRESVFKRSGRRYLITALQLQLRRGEHGALAYPQLQSVFEGCTRPPSLHEVMEAVKKLRASKSMLWSEADENRRSAGSFFLNPVLSRTEKTQLLASCQALGLPSPPLWPAEETGRETLYKVPAAWLIERAGISKGSGRGAVGISSAHSLAIINRGGAGSHEILQFARWVQRTVWRCFHIWLTPEPQWISSALDQSPLRFRPKIALVSCRALPEWEVDDQPLWSALEDRDVELCLPVWDDERFDWQSCDLVIPRTTWDYQERWEEFLAWFKRVGTCTQLLNSSETLEWNIDKRYLKELPIPQPPTHWIDQQYLSRVEALDLAGSLIRLCRENGWQRGFLKPHIGASARGTFRFSTRDAHEQAALAQHLMEWLPQRHLILQPYLDNVEERGEVSLIFFEGELSHAVQKIPVRGDYRVQDDYGASDHPWEPPLSWVKQCEALLSSLPIMPLYARCDALQDEEGDFRLVELELIEPSLFFRHDLESPARFAAAILRRCPSPH